MERAQIKEARRFGDTFAALDDIVRVKMTYINDSELYATLGRNTTVTGRIQSFEDAVLVLDISTQYNSKQIDLPYTKIQSIEGVTSNDN